MLTIVVSASQNQGLYRDIQVPKVKVTANNPMCFLTAWQLSGAGYYPGEKSHRVHRPMWMPQNRAIS